MDTDKIMSQVDLLVVLDNGKVVDADTPESLSKKRSPHFQGQFPWPSGDRQHEVNGIQKATGTEDSNSTRSPQGPLQDDLDTAPGTTVTDEEKLKDVRRKNGDLSVYSYYLSSAGFVSVGLYALTMALWIFCTEFSSESC